MKKRFWVWKNTAPDEDRVLELNGTIAEESWFEEIGRAHV